MSDKLDRFTKRARHVLTLAQETALRFNHNAINPEYLLLGIAREEDSMAAKVLHELGVEPRQIISAVERSISRSQTPPSRKPMLTDHTKRVIELAVNEAHQMGHHSIGTEHLLLGLVGQERSLAVKVLRESGINLNNVRTEVMRHILQRQAQGSEGKELSLEEAMEILRVAKIRPEMRHQVLITDEAVNVAVHLAARYLTGGFLSDKALDLLNEASKLARMHNVPTDDILGETLLKLAEAKRMKQEALEAQRFDEALELRHREEELEAKFSEHHPRVTMEDIAHVISLRTGEPVDRLIAEERARLQGNT